MNEKRFVNKGKEILQKGEWWCSANSEHCADVISTALNELIKENEELKKENEFAKLLANHRAEMVTFANSLIQDIDDELTQKMWYQFKEEMYQKWKKKKRDLE